MGYFGLEPDEREDFEKWSGIKYLDISSMREWNSRHGHLLTLVASNRPKDDMPKIIAIWRQKKASTPRVELLD